MSEQANLEEFNEDLFHFEDEQGEFTLTRSDMHVINVLDGSFGFKPGSFTTSLIETITKADSYNLMKLASLYYQLCLSVYNWKNGDLAQRMERAKNSQKSPVE